MAKFPMKFEVQATASSGINSRWSAQTDSLPPIPSAIPPEFSGPGGGYSPEDLFALSIVNCMIATFKVYCEKATQTFQNIQAKAILTVDKMPTESCFGMTEINIAFHVTGSSNPDKIKMLLESAIKDCAVSNSIKSGKTFNIHVS